MRSLSPVRILLALILLAGVATAADSSPPAVQRVFYTGHSFHMFVPRNVEQIVKAAGIHIYTIGFEINAGSVVDPVVSLALLKNCASDVDSYFDAQNESALTAAFTAIGDQISLLRISQ